MPEAGVRRTPRMRVAAIGMVTPGPDWSQLEHQLMGAAGRGAVLALLPELFAWPYFGAAEPQLWHHAFESLAGPTLAWAAEIAARGGIVLLVPMPHASDNGYRHNAVVRVDPDRRCRVVATKIHLAPPGRDGCSESDHFASGPAQVMVHAVGALRIAVLICYDRRIPACWQAARAAGAELVLVPVAGPADDPADYFHAEIRTHARETGVYVLTAAKCGIDAIGGEHVRNDGDTIAVAPDGSILAALHGCPGLVLLDVDKAALALARQRTASFDRARPVVGHHMNEQ